MVVPEVVVVNASAVAMITQREVVGSVLVTQFSCERGVKCKVRLCNA